jgi:6-oxo-cyclohex-1-ene-carbonyl-CoA hydrolase
VFTDRWLDEAGRVVHGEPRKGDDLAAGKDLLRRGSIDLAPLDEAVDRLVTRLAMTMPGCLSKTIESVRKHKLAHWDRNRESNRAWLGLNMMTEGRAGFRAFHEATGRCREADFLLLRSRLAAGATWDETLVDAVLARAHGKEPGR